MRKHEIIIIFILISISFIRFFFFLDKPEDIYIQNTNKTILVDGSIVDVPDIRIKDQRLVFRPKESKTNILLVIPKDTMVSYGDELSVQGLLESPENFVTKQERIFNYKRYLANKDIYFIIRNPSIKIISNGNGSSIKKVLFKIRTYFIDRMDMILVSPQSDLANGLLLGTRGGFTKEQNDKFINTGTIHITALSGYNISIVAESLISVFVLFFNVTLATVFSFLGIVLFVVMSGGSATSIRAGIMASILFLGKITGRIYDAKRALFIALLLMCVYDLRIVTDISFQLSFIATFGLLFITPKVEPIFMWVTNKLQLRQMIATTVACTIAVLPMLLYTTGIFSIVSIPANILILPFIPITMFLAFIACVLSYVYLPLGFVFGYLANLPLSYIIKIIDFFSNLSFASTVVPSFHLHFMIIAYIWILWWVFRKDDII